MVRTLEKKEAPGGSAPAGAFVLGEGDVEVFKAFD